MPDIFDVGVVGEGEGPVRELLEYHDRGISFDSVGWMDLADIFLDVDTNGEGVDFYAVKA